MSLLVLYHSVWTIEKNIQLVLIPTGITIYFDRIYTREKSGLIHRKLLSVKLYGNPEKIYKTDWISIRGTIICVRENGVFKQCLLIIDEQCHNYKFN